MKVLLTGATGFIGSNLVKKLLSRKYKVSLFVRSTSKFNLVDKGNAKLIFGDMTNPLSVEKAVKNIDIVFNLAGGLPHHHLSDKQYWDINVGGLKNILRACKNSKIKQLVHVSTVGIFSSIPNDSIDENSPLSLTSAYAKTKAKGEQLISEYKKKYRLPVTIIRPTIAYGPGDIRPGFLNLFVLMKKGLFIPIGKGDNFFHTIYVENLVDALILSTEVKKAVGEDFIIGDDPCPTMKEMISTIARVTKTKLHSFYLPRPIAFSFGALFDIGQKIGLPAPLTIQRVRFITENRRFKIDKAKKILKYKAKVKLNEGMQKTYLWYKDKGYI